VAYSLDKNFCEKVFMADIIFGANFYEDEK
jgi:hypothetical protein